MKQYTYFLKICLLFLGITAGFQTVSAQIAEPGTPASFDFQEEMALRSGKLPQMAPINFDITKLREEDRTAEETGLMPRTSVIIPVRLNMENAAEWSVLPNGVKTGILHIKAPEAIAIMLYYDRFYIPEGGKLFIYNADRSHLLGAYTSNTNPNDKKFASEFVAGDEVILEYNEPLYNEPLCNDQLYNDPPTENSQTGKNKPDIRISGIGYGYNHLDVFQAKNPQFGVLPDFINQSCQVNINCPEGNNWQDPKKGIAKSIAPIGNSGYLCSGSLINNTAQDLTPYYLSAHHCFEGVNISFDQIMFYFHYESPDCSTSVPAGTKTVVGAQLLVDLPIKGSSDGVLMKLNSHIPADYNVFYNGWDRRNTPATSGAGIHHPKGEIKKIATYTSPLSSSRWSGDGATGANDAHWQVNFVKTQSGFSQPEGGSSGSPLFNRAGLIVGTLTGGTPANCTSGSTNWYGKLSYHWNSANAVAGSTKSMKDYLDPLNTGAEILDGIYNAETAHTGLLNLTVNQGELVPQFNTLLTDYTVNVANSIDRITVSADAVEPDATVTGTGTYPLNDGKNPIRITVTSPDRSQSKTYTVTVNRTVILPADVYEPNNTPEQSFPLPAIFVNGMATVETAGSNFHHPTDIDYYRIDLPQGYNYSIFAGVHDLRNSDSFTVDAVFACSTDGSSWSEEYDDVMQGNKIILDGGTIHFRVSPYFEGDAGTYLLEINIERKPTGGGLNAGLKSLSISPGSFTSLFNTNTTNYTAHIGNSIAGVTVSAIPADANATVSGAGYFQTKVGTNIIPVVVTAQNGRTQKTYSITVVRRAEAGNNANLQNLTVDQGVLTPRFAPMYTNYHVAVENNVTQINISAKTADDCATLTGAGETRLDAGENRIDLVVMAENGSTYKTYEITVTRELIGSTEIIPDYHPVAYPNPAREQITVSGLTGSGTLSITDVIGRERIRHNINSFEEKIAIRSLSSGIYFLRVIEKEKTSVIKIIVN